MSEKAAQGKDIGEDTASTLWVQNLAESGYEQHCTSIQELQYIRRFGRIWRMIFRHTKIQPPAKMFELGSGGGRYLALLSLNGYSVTGVDVSPEVTERSKRFIAEIDTFEPIADKVKIECANFFTYAVTQQYNLCYHFGVVEHFLDSKDRKQIWDKLVEMTLPGGWVASAVPCGKHIIRNRVRKFGLCGYCVPEIDYGVEEHRLEFEEAGLTNIITVPTNYFGFYPALPGYSRLKILYKLLFYGLNVVGPFIPMPLKVRQKFCHSLLVLGQKPERLVIYG